MVFSIVKMMLNKTKRNRKKYGRGLASAVTGAILLSAVSIMGVMLLTWSQSNIIQQKQEIEDVFSTQMNRINEDLIFENIWFATPSGDMTQNHLNVTFANIGILGLNITQIDVANVTGTNNTAPFSYYYTDGGIVRSESLSVNTTYPWQSGDELEIIAFTDRGNQHITQEVAP